MQSEKFPEGKDGFLYEMGPGKIFYCACSERVVLEYKEHFLVFRKPMFRYFLQDFGKVLRCPALRQCLSQSGSLEVQGYNGRISLSVNLSEATELFKLLDTTALYLEAHSPAGQPFHSGTN